MPRARPLEHVHVGPLPPERFRSVVDDDRWRLLDAANHRARSIFGARVVWNVNSTATGGGVAEMLHSLTAYARGAGVDARWGVMEADEEFFTLTKRLHHLLHGSAGDGAGLSLADHALYERVTRENAQRLAAELSPGDVVVLHDPQTAGMAPALADCGVALLWRSHIGVDEPNDAVRTGWDFLTPFLDDVDAFIFTRRAYVPPQLEGRDVSIICPSIDVFSEKNHPMTGGQIASVLVTAQVLHGEVTVAPTYVTRSGGLEHLTCRAQMDEDAPAGLNDRLVLQVGRWDPLKDPIGVIEGFAEHVAAYVPDAHLMLAGPAPEDVDDDPEALSVLHRARAVRAALPADVRARVHLACVPICDRGENAAVINALQRHATVVVQKSLAEGFGLTVTEAMWKSRPVVASAVGGICDQIVSGVHGLLLDDPTDLPAFGAAITALLTDARRSATLGRAAHDRVGAEFLGSRHLIQLLGLFGRLIDEHERAASAV
ncbi:unannotated protein [freshwater metagenome]|uniref:Unannotated protein n=1 Tax=freshwater metagenome TaxID=449393 RepID=A0A6J7J4E1_9ZZZZ|nr:glycosyltransferase [Actinomycetota bacterium]